jgi:hypothetical protein
MNNTTVAKQALYLEYGEECLRFTLQAPNIAQYIMLLHIAETWCRLAESVRDEDVSPQTLH